MLGADEISIALWPSGGLYEKNSSDERAMMAATAEACTTLLPTSPLTKCREWLAERAVFSTSARASSERGLFSMGFSADISSSSASGKMKWGAWSEHRELGSAALSRVANVASSIRIDIPLAEV